MFRRAWPVGHRSSTGHEPQADLESREEDDQINGYEIYDSCDALHEYTPKSALLVAVEVWLE